MINMKLAQKHSTDTLNHVLDTAIIVVRWLKAQPGGDHSSLPQAITWLQTLCTQVSVSVIM